MIEHIADSEGKTYSVVSDDDEDDDSYYAPMVLDGRRWIGEARCLIRSDGTMELADIHIRDMVPARQSCLTSLIPWDVWCKLTGKSYRHRGIGTALLQHVLRYARSRGLKRIVGRVVPHDLEESSWLPGWYARNGFIILPADSLHPSDAALLYLQLEP